MELDSLFSDLAKPWPTFREDLQQRLRATIVSFKPDHGRKGKPEKNRDVTSGRLHNETAYGLTGKVNARGAPIVVHRIPFMSLQPKDLTNPERIADKLLQEELYKATQGLSGSEFQKALSDFSKTAEHYKGIRHVRVREPLHVIAIRDANGRPYKAYQGDSNERYNVWSLPDGSWTYDVISTYDFHRHDFVEQRPHPAAKKIMSLKQDDILAIEKEPGIRSIVRVQKFGQNGQIFLINHNETGNMAQRDKDPDDPFKLYGPGVNALKKMKARQIRIDELGQIFDPGPRD